ncbi:MAG: adenylate/guanylate cyclase domain-containing protein [Planctomycetia bacterium]
MTSSPYISDYERRRRERETANERVVSAVIAAFSASILLATTRWWLPENGGDAIRALPDAVPHQAWNAALVIFAAHLSLLVWLWLYRGYSPLRRYAIVVMRMTLLGYMCWAQWHNARPLFGLLLPIGGFGGAIVVTGLSYSRSAVVLAGALACLVYPTISLLGPTWPDNITASIYATHLFVAVTAVTYWLVSSMLTMSAESVSNERLSRFFSPEIASWIAAEPELAVRATGCRVTVLFSDISGFTAMSSRMTPEEVVDLLNAYFPRMVEIVFRHGGTLEKFIGDALLAVWGAPVARPDDTDRAVAAANEMQEDVARFNAESEARGRPPIAIHVGIASGPAAAGYIGTDRYVQYAVIGDTTNVAARICAAAGRQETLVSDATRNWHSGEGVVFQTAPAIAAKGKDAPVVVHRVRPAP